MTLLESNKFRYAVGMTVAVLLSLAVGFFWLPSGIMLIPLVALFVMQTSIGNAFYQGVRKLLLVMFLVLVFFLFCHSKYFFMTEAKNVLAGAAIGIAANLLLFPRRADIEFRQKVVPVVDVYQRYFSAIIASILQRKTLSDNANMENVLYNLPGWVLERGFDIGLQKGYQFFLAKLEQISDILFAMHYLARHSYEDETVEQIRQPLEDCHARIDKFFSSILQVLQLKKLSEGVEDFQLEIELLEKKFYKLAPQSLELLDFREDYVYFAEFIYCLRDLRSFMIKLGEALR